MTGYDFGAVLLVPFPFTDQVGFSRPRCSGTQKAANARSKVIPPQLAFPYNENVPATLFERRFRPAITILRCLDLCTPELGPRRRLRRKRTLPMTMPKATVHEDHLVPSRKNNVGCSGQIADMQSIAIAHRMQHLAHDEFRLCVATSNTRHVVSPLIGCQHIDHSLVPRLQADHFAE